MSDDGFRALLSAWTPGELAQVLGVPYETARAMRSRNSVAAHYWPRLIEAGRDKGLLITADMLARFAEERNARGGQIRGTPGEAT